MSVLMEKINYVVISDIDETITQFTQDRNPKDKLERFKSAVMYKPQQFILCQLCMLGAKLIFVTGRKESDLGEETRSLFRQTMPKYEIFYYPEDRDYGLGDVDKWKTKLLGKLIKIYKNNCRFLYFENDIKIITLMRKSEKTMAVPITGIEAVEMISGRANQTTE